jgi:hypothetical protein
MENLTGYNDYINESKLQDDYRAFFSKLLDLYKIKSPAVFKSKPEESKKFYGEIAKGWTKGKGLTEYGKKLMDMEELVTEDLQNEEETLNEKVITINDLQDEDEDRYRNFITEYNQLVSRYELGIGRYGDETAILDVYTNKVIILDDTDDLTINLD